MKWREEGDSALLFTWPEVPLEEANLRALSLRRGLAGRIGSLLREAIPGMASLLLVYDPLRAEPQAILELVERTGDEPSGTPRPRRVEIPVRYGGADGPDLERVARHAGLSPTEVVRRHAAALYRVAFLGFMPGFPYLLGLPPELAAPRLDTPRARVPAGSLAIGGAQAGIYPAQSPGGWNLIGRTSTVLCDWGRDDPFFLEPGDQVVFREAALQVGDSPPATDLLAPGPAPACEVRSGGLLTTLQDLGRPGHGHQGVPSSGPMDPLAFRLANLAAGNAESACALELAFPGPRLLFLERVSIALGGADLGARLGGRGLPLFERVEARAGEELAFGEWRRGQWAYLALAGGITARKLLRSASTDTRSRIGRRISAGDRLSLEGPGGAAAPRIPPELAALGSGEAVVRVIPAGAGFAEVAVGAEVVLSAERDRSGYRTLARFPGLAGREASLLSEGIPPGTVQLPPDGRPIFLLADRPTTGGYAKLAFVATVDLRVIAQCAPRARVRLKAITAAEARALLRDERAALDGLAGDLPPLRA